MLAQGAAGRTGHLVHEFGGTMRSPSYRFWLKGDERTEAFLWAESDETLIDQYRRWPQMVELKRLDDARPVCARKAKRPWRHGTPGQRWPDAARRASAHLWIAARPGAVYIARLARYPGRSHG